MDEQDEASSPVRLCVLGLGGGGFHFEVESLLEQVETPVELVLIYAIESHVDATWGAAAPVSDVFVVRSPAMRGDGRWTQIRAFAVAGWRAFWILLGTKPDCILAVGTAHAVPFGIAGRLLGVPLYFVESITRVNRESNTARLVRRLRLARWHRVQWEMLADPPETEFRGSLLQ